MAQSERELLAEIAKLKGQLGDAIRAKTEAEEMATATAAASAFMGTSEEQPTGRTATVRVCVNPAEKKEDKLVWKNVEVPTWFYAVNLPVSAPNLATNGIEYYHGQTYELDPYQLADLKSRVARCWDHEKAIHSENENAYRKPTNIHLVSPAARAAGAH